VKAAIETGGNDAEKPDVSDESIDHDNKVNSSELDSKMQVDNACPSTDDEEDRVVFNADIVCSEHGELMLTQVCLCYILIPICFTKYIFVGWEYWHIANNMNHNSEHFKHY